MTDVGLALARYRDACHITQGLPTVEVLMDDMFYPGMHGAIFPCVVFETRHDGSRLCEISQDNDRYRFWAPLSNVMPMRPREATRIDWQQGQRVEVGMRFSSEDDKIFEPFGYWPAVIVELVGSGSARIRWTGRYDDGHKPVFHFSALRTPTVLQ